MSDPLLTIGAFARAVGLSPSALRFYDECGLLSPADVDETTGYRYYTPDLARRAQLVAQMRDAGMSIETMRAVLDGSVDQSRAALRGFADDLEARSARTSAIVVELLAATESSNAPEMSARIVVRGPELASAMRQVRQAAHPETTSPLGSVLIDVMDGSVDVVATNRHWMAVRTLRLGMATDPARVVLSLSTAARLTELLDGCDEAVVKVGDEGVSLAGHDFPAKDVAYPAHRIVMDGLEPAVVRVLLPRDELTAAIEATGRSEVSVSLADGYAQITGAASDAGRSVAARISGSPMTVRLGAALVQRALSCVLGADVEWTMSAPDRPIRITSPYQPGFVALVMPLGGA